MLSCEVLVLMSGRQAGGHVQFWEINFSLATIDFSTVEHLDALVLSFFPLVVVSWQVHRIKEHVPRCLKQCYHQLADYGAMFPAPITLIANCFQGKMLRGQVLFENVWNERSLGG